MFPKNVSNYHYKTLHAIMWYESLNGKVVEIHFIQKRDTRSIITSNVSTFKKSHEYLLLNIPSEIKNRTATYTVNPRSNP